MKKKYNYLLIFLVLFFSSLENVDAIKFRKNTSIITNGRMFYNSVLDFSKTKQGAYTHGSVYKEYTKDNTNYYNAFCSDKSVNFYSGSAYTEDLTYKNTAKCTYKVKEGNSWVARTGGDCSKLLGYTIQAAYAKAETISTCKSSTNQLKYCKYGYAQAATWTYLSLFSYDAGGSSYLRTNNNYTELKNAYDNNSTLKSIIQDAWTNYNNDINNGRINNNEVVDNGMYTISGGGDFYYVPDKDQCGSTGGIYRTNDITITNNKNKTIKVTISNQSTGVTLNFPNESVTSTDKYIVELGAGENITFYLSATQFIGNEGTNNTTAKVNVYGEFTELSTSTEIYTTYDSERWTRSGAQGLILVTTDTSNYAANTKYKKEVNLSYRQNRLQFNRPQGNSTDEGTSKCANIAATINETSAELQGANCKVINLGDNSFVRIIISETVRFNYGYLHPHKYENFDEEPIVYAGGGFNLNTNESLAITKYQAAISWQFADYNLGDSRHSIPYFYNATNVGQTNPYRETKIYKRRRMTIKEIINQILLEEIREKYQNLVLDIDTYDSNKIKENGSGESITHEFNIYETAQTKTEINKQFDSNNEIQFEISKIELNRYKFKDGKNGDIEYCLENNETCESNGYINRGYFIPMYYQPGTFDFNIKNQNISLIDEITLNYSGECNIKTKNQFNIQSLRYRSIDVQEPFPTGKIPSNWQAWYQDSTNQQRIATTYDKEMIYNIKLTKEKQKAIAEYNKKPGPRSKGSYYTDWTNMNTSGRSNVIQELFEDNKKGETTSYCGLGIFKEECDQQPNLKGGEE